MCVCILYSYLFVLQSQTEQLPVFFICVSVYVYVSAAMCIYLFYKDKLNNYPLFFCICVSVYVYVCAAVCRQLQTSDVCVGVLWQWAVRSMAFR